MDISTRMEFAATPEQVFALMIDQRFLEAVCQACGALGYDASVDGLATRTRRTLPSPESAARFTGPQLTVVEDIGWADADPDGARTGVVKMIIMGQPVTMNGELRLSAGGPGTVAELSGDLKVAVPILGKKLEQSAAPAVLAGFRTQQKVGNDWLARS
jgi:hypothetical protein